jgi:hypothetical protein
MEVYDFFTMVKDTESLLYVHGYFFFLIARRKWSCRERFAGSGWVCGFQLQIVFDFVNRLNGVFGFVHSLIGSADEVG